MPWRAYGVAYLAGFGIAWFMANMTAISLVDPERPDGFVAAMMAAVAVMGGLSGLAAFQAISLGWRPAAGRDCGSGWSRLCWSLP